VLIASSRCSPFAPPPWRVASRKQACAGALQNVLREASQPVPEDLLKFGSSVKKKEHKLYGAFGPKDDAPLKAATKITFDDDE
jgi:ATP-dependent RNA helicase DBP3